MYTWYLSLPQTLYQSLHFEKSVSDSRAISQTKVATKAGIGTRIRIWHWIRGHMLRSKFVICIFWVAPIQFSREAQNLPYVTNLPRIYNLKGSYSSILSTADSIFLYQLSTADSTFLHPLSTADITHLFTSYLLLTVHFFIYYLLLIAHFFISYLLLIAHFFNCSCCW